MSADADGDKAGRWEQKVREDDRGERSDIRARTESSESETERWAEVWMNMKLFFFLNFALTGYKTKKGLENRWRGSM